MSFKEIVELLFNYKITFLLITMILVIISGMFALQLKYIFKIIDKSYKKHNNTHILLEFIITSLSKITYLSSDSIINLLNKLDKDSDEKLVEVVLKGIASNKYIHNNKQKDDTQTVRQTDQKYLFKNKKNSEVNINDNSQIIQDLINNPEKLNDFIKYKQELTEK